MNDSVALFLARRLSLADYDHRRQSPGMIIAVISLALSFVVMLISIAVVTGFKSEIRQKVTGFDSAITITPTGSGHYEDGERTLAITLTDSLRAAIASVAPDASVDISLPQPGILKTTDNFSGIVLKGFVDGATFQFIRQNLVEGEMPMVHDPDSKNSVVISAETARKLKLSLGDRVDAHFITDNSLRTRRLNIVGIYDTHFAAYDKLYAFAPIALTQSLCDVDSLTGAMIEINGIPDSQIDDATMELRSILWQQEVNNPLPRIYSVQNVHSTSPMYFSWLAMLDTNVVVILILMAAVAAVTLISSLIIIILEHVNLIGMLKALGADNALIRRIFIFMTQRLVARGLIAGNIIALSIILLQHYFHILPLDPEAYYLDYVPVLIDWWVVIVLNVAFIAVSSLVLLFPSHIIASMSPAKSIKFD